MRRARGVLRRMAALFALFAALALCGCDVPAAGAPVLYADQKAQAADYVVVASDGEAAGEADAASEAPAASLSPAESIGEGVVALCFENRLGATITSLSLRPAGTDDWPEDISYAGLSIPNGSQFLLRVDAVPTEKFDLSCEGADGTTFLMLGSDLASVAMDHRHDSLIMLRYDNGVTYMEYTNLFGLSVDTHLSAQESLASMRAELEDRTETFTFTERDMEGVEAGQETENCLD